MMKGPIALLSVLAVLFGGAAPPVRPAEERTASEGPAPRREDRLAERDRCRERTAKLRREGKVREAIEACREMLAIERAVFGDSGEAVTGSIEQLAQMREELGEFDAARECREEVLRIRTRLYGEADCRVTEARLDLEDLRRRGQMTPEDRALLEEAAKLNRQARAMYLQGRSKESLPLAEKAAEIRGRILGHEHRSYAQSLVLLGAHHHAVAAYTRAEPLYREAAEITRKALGEWHPDHARSLHNLATLYHEKGDNGRAEPLYRRALEIKKKAVGEGDPDYASTLSNLAMLYRDMGDYDRAEPLMRQAFEIYRKALGDGRSDYAMSLNNLATLYDEMGDYRRAEPLYREALEISRKAGEGHPRTAHVLQNLALLYEHTGDRDRAEPLYREALEIYEKAVGEENPHYALNLHNLAGLYEGKGDHDRAEPLFLRALAIRKKVLGEGHPDYAASLHKLSHLYRSKGDVPRAEGLMRQALALIRANMDLASSIQSERQQLGMTREFRYFLDCYLSLTSGWKGSSTDETYRLALAWKGAVFSRQSRRRLLRTEPDLSPLFEELESASGRLASLVLSRPEPGEKEAWSRQVTGLTERKEEIEEEISRRSPGFRRTRELSRLTPGDLRAALPEKSALVDLYEYTPSRLLSFVVTRDGPVVQIDLGPLKPIEEAIDAWREAIASDAGSPKESEASAKLRAAIWEPIEKHLGDARLVLASPDGALGRFPLAALPGSRPGTYLIEEYSIALVPVPLLLPDTIGGKTLAGDPSLLLVGDVDFDAEPAKPTEAAARGPETGSPRGEARDAPRRGGRLLDFRPLEFTRGEMLMVADTFEEAHGGSRPTRLRGQAASEPAFREAAPRHRFIHLATHGFFAPEELKSALAPPKKDAAGESLPDLGPAGNITGWHPGLLSGIVLAGANRKIEGEGDDGILTALELAAMDLSRTDLVVLSACETGLGATAGGEGLLGIQRAAQVAGARTAIASLWKVSDQDAQALMARFYENLWKRKMGKLEALREAQLAILRGTIARGPGAIRERKDGEASRASVRNWAAWVLSGEWR